MCRKTTEVRRFRGGGGRKGGVTLCCGHEHNQGQHRQSLHYEKDNVGAVLEKLRWKKERHEGFQGGGREEERVGGGSLKKLWRRRTD